MIIRTGHLFSTDAGIIESKVNFHLRKIPVKWFSDSAKITFFADDIQLTHYHIIMSKKELEDFINELNTLNDKLQY